MSDNVILISGSSLTERKLNAGRDHQCKNCRSELVSRMSQFIESFEDFAAFRCLGFGEERGNSTNYARDRELT